MRKLLCCILAMVMLAFGGCSLGGNGGEQSNSSTSKEQSVNTIEFVQTESENLQIKNIFGVDRFNHLVIKREEGKVIYSATLNTDREFSSSKLNAIMLENEFILSIERDDDL